MVCSFDWIRAALFSALSLSVISPGAIAYEFDDYQKVLETRNCSGCDLSGADLSFLDLTDADLNGANLQNADLTSANLTSANLTGADLSGANLSDALVTDADLTDAILLDVVGLPALTVQGSAPISNRATSACLDSAEGRPFAITLNSPTIVAATADPLQLYWYMPTMAEAYIYFEVIEDLQNETVYQETFYGPDGGGIASLPINEALLETDKVYRWQFSVYCRDGNHDVDFLMQGQVKLVEDSTPVQTDASDSSALEVSAIYVEAGLWHNALTVLTLTRQNFPQNKEVAQAWQDHLEQSGFGSLVNQPLLGTLMTVAESNQSGRPTTDAILNPEEATTGTSGEAVRPGGPYAPPAANQSPGGASTGGGAR